MFINRIYFNSNESGLLIFLFRNSRFIQISFNSKIKFIYDHMRTKTITQRSKTPFSTLLKRMKSPISRCRIRPLIFGKKQKKGDKEEKRWKEAIGYGWIFWAWQFRLIEGLTGIHASALERTSVPLHGPIGEQGPRGPFIGPLDPA